VRELLAFASFGPFAGGTLLARQSREGRPTVEMPGGALVSYRTLEGRLAELRERRMLLRELRDDVDLAWRGLALPALAESWRSEAQRGYAARRSDLAVDLRRAFRQLDDALTDVAASIEQVTASLDRAAAAVAQAVSPG
jgi:hypothetical protein